jgi:DnaJ family protein C protein 28
MPKWDDLVEKKIKDAMKEGVFDNLPGYGQPLRLEENPFEDPTMRTAHRLLRSNGFSLPWIEERKEIESAIETARAVLARSWAKCGDARMSRRRARDAQHEADWEHELNFFRRRVVDINRRIASFNLKAPSEAFQRMPLDVEYEIQKVTQGKQS